MKHCHVPNLEDVCNHEAQDIHPIGLIDSYGRKLEDFHPYLYPLLESPVAAAGSVVCSSNLRCEQTCSLGIKVFDL